MRKKAIQITISTLIINICHKKRKNMKYSLKLLIVLENINRLKCPGLKPVMEDIVSKRIVS